jgi:hypothetical protein
MTIIRIKISVTTNLSFWMSKKKFGWRGWGGQTKEKSHCSRKTKQWFISSNDDNKNENKSVPCSAGKHPFQPFIIQCNRWVQALICQFLSKLRFSDRIKNRDTHMIVFCFLHYYVCLEDIQHIQERSMTPL